MPRHARRKHPEYISSVLIVHWSEYRFIAGQGKIQAFVLGAIKGVAWGVLPIVAGSFRLRLFHAGFGRRGVQSWHCKEHGRPSHWQ
jgi:hypothetical protein